MAVGTVLENLSNRKLCAILSTLVGLQLVFIFLGAVIAPPPSTSMDFMLTRCRDKNHGQTNEWFYIRPKHCDVIEPNEGFDSYSPDARDIVFVAQLPHARSGAELEYSPWFQFLLGLLDIEVEYIDGVPVEENIQIQLEIRMAYRTKQDSPENWHELISTTIDRELSCTIDPHKRMRGYTYNCSIIDLFELGANNYPFYLLNIRLPINKTYCNTHNRVGPNCNIPAIKDLHVIAIHQNGGFTAVWLWLKTLISPFIILATFWYYKRMSLLNRQRFLIEKCILALGVSLVVLDFPLEWISLYLKMPFMLLISDIRQGLFYTVLLSFWLIYAGEHLLDDSSRNSLRNYKYTLGVVLSGCICLLIYDLFERGAQLSDPFHSIWSTKSGRQIAYTTLHIATLCSILYFAFLVYKIFRAWSTIKQKRAAQLYRMSEHSRLKVENVIYRFKFLMFFTVTCALFTIISYFLKQYGENSLHGEDYDESSWLSNSTSAFFTGTFGMWNIYVLLLLSMYAPSHKYYANAQMLEDENVDLMNTGTESAPLTTFLKPSAD
ncbi:Protein of unknown function DUF1171 domain containing protein [Aphelenchoides bicaudatus]|nr:Protein of unknown function DUF1171 domain containing protein [Aphelenchoides bicaudatus]